MLHTVDFNICLICNFSFVLEIKLNSVWYATYNVQVTALETKYNP